MRRPDDLDLRARRRATIGAGALSLAGCLLAASCSAPAILAPAAERGVLDLRAWSPQHDGAARLDGDWRFFPRRLLTPGDPALELGDGRFAHVPGTWRDAEASPEGVDGHGYATYALTVLLPEPTPALALRLITVSTAYRLYAAGKLVAAAGEVAPSPARSRPSYRPQIAGLPPVEGGRLELVLQASNFAYARGGPWEPIWIGPPEAIEAARETRISLALFLAGAFGVIGLYHLIGWLVRRRDLSPLYFATVCFAMAARGLTVDEVYLSDLLPRLSWASLVRFEYGSLLLIVATMPLFLREIFPHDLPLGIVRAYSIAAFAGLGIVLVVPPGLFSRGLPLIQALSLSAAVIASICVTVAVVRRRSGAVLFLIGMIAILATGVYDVLVSTDRELSIGWFNLGAVFLQPFGLFVFVLSQAILLARRSARAVDALEETTERLQEAHHQLDARAHELEQRVAERTAALESANRTLAHLAEVDDLTLVGNRRHFEEELRRAWFDHFRRRAPLSLVMVDVDFFKAFNDRYGHVAGDEALREVAHAIVTAAYRPGDLVARYGGEELAVLLANTDREGAAVTAERIRDRVESLGLLHEISEVARSVTVSVGVATLVPRSDLQRSELVELADQALYRAKQTGRNRVVVA